VHSNALIANGGFRPILLAGIESQLRSCSLQDLQCGNAQPKGREPPNPRFVVSATEKQHYVLSPLSDPLEALWPQLADLAAYGCSSSTGIAEKLPEYGDMQILKLGKEAVPRLTMEPTGAPLRYNLGLLE
jgi:hypothetical protein